MGLDRHLFWLINRLSAATGWAHEFMAAYALWGGLCALVLVWLVCWAVARRRDDTYRSMGGVLLTGMATVLALCLNQIIGPLVNRPRPFVAMPHVLMLLPHSADSSFPSDHAMIAGAFAGGLLLVHRRWAAVAGALAVLLAFARVYAGVHYPSDVVGGLLIGGALAVTLVASLRGVAARGLRTLSDTPIAPLVRAAHPPVPTHDLTPTRELAPTHQPAPTRDPTPTHEWTLPDELAPIRDPEDDQRDRDR